MNDQDNARLKISRLHLLLANCCMAELASAKVKDVDLEFIDAYGDDGWTSVEIEPDDIAQKEILDALIRYKQRLQSKLSDLEISLALSDY